MTVFTLQLTIRCLLVFGVVSSSGIAQERDANKTTEEWISQLESDRVRLRDEAEDFLRETPGAYEILESYTKTSVHQEAVIRARNILRYLKSYRWELVGIRHGHSKPEDGAVIPRGLVVAQNSKKLYSRSKDFIREWNAGSYEPLRTFGESSWNMDAPPLSKGLTRSLAISPNSKMIAGTSEEGEVIVYDANSLKELSRFADEKAKPFIEKGEPNEGGTILSVFFMPDHKRIVTGHPWGVTMWDIKKEKILWTKNVDAPVSTIAMVPNRQKILACSDSKPDGGRLFTLAVGSGTTLDEFELPTKLGGLIFDSAGLRLLGCGENGYAYVYDIDPKTGIVSHNQSHGPLGKECQSAIWGPEETTILSTSRNPKSPMIEWDLETGDIVWSSPPLEFGLGAAQWIDHDRIVVLGAGEFLTVWKFRG